MKEHTTRVEYQRKNRRENLITVILVSIIIIIGAVALFYGTHSKFGGGNNHKSSHQTTTKVIKHKHHRKHHHKLTINENNQNPDNSNSNGIQNSKQPAQPIIRHRSRSINSTNNGTGNDVSIHKNNPIAKPQKKISKPVNNNPVPAKTPKPGQQNAPAQKGAGTEGVK